MNPTKATLIVVHIFHSDLYVLSKPISRSTLPQHEDHQANNSIWGASDLGL